MPTSKPSLTNLRSLIVIAMLIASLLSWTGGVRAEPPQPTPTPTRAPFAYGVSFLSPGEQVGTTYQGAPDSATAQATADPADLVAEALALINETRQDAGLPPLLPSQALAEAAAAHAGDQLANSFFEHQGSDGSWPAERAARHGHPAAYLGENLAVGYATAQATVDAWLTDDGSRANILDARFTHAGLAFMHNGPWHNYWVLMLSDPPAYRPGRVLVRFQPAVAAASVQETLAQVNATSLGAIGSLDVERLAVPVGQEAAVIAALQQNPAVALAELDYRVQVTLEPNDPGYTGKWWWEKIQAAGAWDVTTGSKDIVIAVIDTGVDLDHPDLAAKIVTGYDFVNNDDDPDDDHGHGTHVAGIAAAVTNNGTGVAGLSWGARIMPLKVLDSSGSGWTSDVASGVTYAADHGARIINMSLGDTEFSSTMASATDYAHSEGVFMTAAAGNNGDNSLFYPAANEHVIGVAATTSSDTRAYFSNYASHVDVAAPGVSIYSTYSGTYATMSGTSMATPFVSGLAALVLSTSGDLTPDEVETIIEQSADDLGDPGRDDYYGWGRINAHQAVITVSPKAMEGNIHTLEGHGVAGVLLTIAGSQTFTTTTDGDGRFGQADLPWGAYVVTPTLADLVFSPLSRTVIISNTDATGVAFTAQISETFDLNGTVRTGEGDGFPGAEIVVASDHLRLTTTTDAQGHFAQTGLISDTYTLTPIAPGQTFDPPITTVALGSEPVSPQDFVMTSFIVSGTVRTSGGQGVADVLLSLSKVGLTTTLTTTTNTSGDYVFTEVVSGTHVLTPTLEGASFEPPTRTLIITSANRSGVDFTRNDFMNYLPLVFRNFATTVFPNDPYFENGTQWGLHNTGQSGGTDDADIDAPEAWGLSTGEDSVIVAIVDSGVDSDHPEFSGRLVTGRHFFNNGQQDGNTEDDNGHGTHVTGIAAATGNNGTGVAGVAWDVRIMPLKVLDSSGSGWYSDMISGINFAVSNGAKVINMSLGGTGYSSGLQDAVTNAYNNGVLVVAAAGNCGDSNYAANGCTYQDQPNYPAANSNVLAVASTTRRDTQSSFSNQGNYVDIAAPGSYIYSTLPGSYGYKSGTSMATPFVAGLAGLLYSRYPGYTADQVARAIVHNADDLGTTGHDDVYGCGRSNAYNALVNGAVSSGCSGWGGLSVESAQAQAIPPADADFHPGVLLVKFQDAASLVERERVLATHDLTTLDVLEGLAIHLVAVPEGQELALMETLNAEPTVAYAEPDYKVYALSLK